MYSISESSENLNINFNFLFIFTAICHKNNIIRITKQTINVKYDIMFSESNENTTVSSPSKMAANPKRKKLSVVLSYLRAQEKIK